VIFTFQQIKHELLLLSKKDHSQFDCSVVIILSHGTEVHTHTHTRQVNGRLAFVPHLTVGLSLNPFAGL